MSKKSALTWRVNDIVVASVLAVACALIFWLWSNFGYSAITTTLALAPEYSPLAGGVWLLAGLLGALVIRKPGAALYTELLAAVIEALLGTHYNFTVVISGLVQGLGAELIFLIFFYKVWNLATAMLAGLASGAAMGISEIIIYYAGEMVGQKAVIYVLCSMISGLVLAGLVSWLLVRGLVSTGALDSLAAGRAARRPSRRGGPASSKG
ncbi:ECF transporter S component [Rothia sp. CCM 9417]|uniref:ECF transporter S component n=1 Tax=Rothia sp. CCM 9417 TaxID=3402657 RepID=UPI003AD8916A